MAFLPVGFQGEGDVDPLLLGLGASLNLLGSKMESTYLGASSQ